MILRGVTLYCTELRGVNSHFLLHSHRPLKGQWHKNKCGCLFYYYSKGLHFSWLNQLNFAKANFRCINWCLLLSFLLLFIINIYTYTNSACSFCLWKSFNAALMQKYYIRAPPPKKKYLYKYAIIILKDWSILTL